MVVDSEGEEKQRSLQPRVPSNKKCRSCQITLKQKPKTFEETSIRCDVCLTWFHATCAQLVKGKYDAIAEYELHWFCSHCEVGSGEIFSLCAKLKTEVAKLKQQVESLNSDKTPDLDAKLEVMKQEVISDLKTQLPAINSVNDSEKIKQQVVREIKAEIAPKRASSAWGTSSSDDNAAPDLRQILSEQLNEQLSEDKNIRKILREQATEDKEIEKIKNNLIISGIKEVEGQNDLDVVKEIISSELNIEADIASIERCGKKRPDNPSPRPIKLLMNDSTNRKQILMKAKTLRDSSNPHTQANVYIRPDQTRRQQEESKNLRDRRRQMMVENPGRTYVIRKNEIQDITKPSTD